MATPQELEFANGGVEDGTSEGEANSTAQQQQSRQPEKVDLTKLDEFKQWQSAADRRVAMAENAAREAAARAAQLEQEYHAQQMRNLDGEDRLAYQNQLMQRQLAEMQRQRDLDAYAIQRQRDLEEIVRETGVPIERIESVANVHEAWSIGNRYLKEQAGKKAATPDDSDSERQPNDTVDVGGGRPMGKSAVLQAEYDKYRKSYDLGKQLEIMSRADKEGVKLNEW